MEVDVQVPEPLRTSGCSAHIAGAGRDSIGRSLAVMSFLAREGTPLIDLAYGIPSLRAVVGLRYVIY